MSGVETLLVFALAGLQCALEVTRIDRVVPAVAISPVPQAPPIVLGLVNVHGRILPVLDIRRLFRLPVIATVPEHRMIIARTASRPVVLVVDDVLGVAEFSGEDMVPPDQVYPGIEYLHGVTGIGAGIVYIYDLERFLSSAEDDEIEQLLAAGLPMPDDQEA
ncbi:chemotaxis protein CheW [Desulfoprunum benzoelyticum]|jgi:purine-binding chemotaxis protein CheW|uniref:Purine-binding chemotaxis protein CheW n=1 Tax=Desulfoprunum benzoelyticum TaxID=1506996 RepID=A0A840UT36_9BACT|nr:chemotaxis protein CheW [Desulfoprunum benzoelyticum]MBB5347913.1 purine-binding chemotaxis protein CheW [Desulfoprunum benzoelyticum]MBM9530330.1 chemotaxis protein CheW [Desulfoprunum benzoelyticum]